MRENTLLLWFKKLIFGTKPSTKSDLERKLEMCASAHESGDYHIAFNIASELANNGNAQSQFNIAGYYENGFYVEKNRETAFKFYKQAADNGFTAAIEKVELIKLNFKTYMLY